MLSGVPLARVVVEVIAISFPPCRFCKLWTRTETVSFPLKKLMRLPSPSEPLIRTRMGNLPKTKFVQPEADPIRVAELKEGDVPLVANVGRVGEGLTLPKVDNVVVTLILRGDRVEAVLGAVPVVPATPISAPKLAEQLQPMFAWNA
jgi:hypothetical protein